MRMFHALNTALVNIKQRQKSYIKFVFHFQYFTVPVVIKVYGWSVFHVLFAFESILLQNACTGS